MKIEDLIPDMDIQLNLVSNIKCSICNNCPGPSDRNPNLWFGFLDQDTGDHICNNCKKEHYQNKFKLKGMKGLYSEVPVVLTN